MLVKPEWRASGGTQPAGTPMRVQYVVLLYLSRYREVILVGQESIGLSSKHSSTSIFAILCSNSFFTGFHSWRRICGFCDRIANYIRLQWRPWGVYFDQLYIFIFINRPFHLCLKAKPRAKPSAKLIAKPLIWKLVLFTCKWNQTLWLCSGFALGLALKQVKDNSEVAEVRSSSSSNFIYTGWPIQLRGWYPEGPWERQKICRFCSDAGSKRFLARAVHVLTPGRKVYPVYKRCPIVHKLTQNGVCMELYGPMGIWVGSFGMFV